MATKDQAELAADFFALNTGEVHFVIYERGKFARPPEQSFFVVTQEDLDTVWNDIRPENVVYSTKGE